MWENKDIYIISAGHEFALSDDDAVCIVYSPLANKAFLVTRDEADHIRTALGELINSERKQHDHPLASLFAEERREHLLGLQIKPEDCTSITILPNNRCNFNCSYCYSANGRSQEQLTVDQILALAKWVYKNASDRRSECRVLFLGGGEPLMSWDVVKRSIIEIESIQEPGGSNIALSISTNGSLLTREKIDFFIQHHVNVQVSFEILEDVQNAQRGHYNVVHNNILQALDAGLSVSIHSVVTNANVARMEEAVRVAHARYANAKTIGLEPVVDSSFVRQDARIFFDLFFRNFVAAEKYAKSQGIQLFNSISKNLQLLRTHFCGSQIVLTPHGTFSSCEAISSPLEEHYNEFIFGGLGGGNQVRVDPAAFRQSHPEQPGFMKEECASCWAKWNCGGGCNYKRCEYSPEVFTEYCRFYRRSILHLLANRLRDEFARQSGGNSLDQEILNNHNL